MARKPASARSPLPAAPAPNDADPQSWLFLNPNGPSPTGIVFGVLRKSYAGRTNSAREFGFRKAHVGVGKDADPARWSPNIERVEVLLPPGADDSLTDPATLLGQMDAHAVEREKALLVCLTLPLGDVDRVHVGWERARAFVRARIVQERELGCLLCLHAPQTINAPFPLHAHALVVPRRLTGLGLRHGLYDEDLTHDGGQAIIEAAWAEHCRPAA